MVSFSNGVEPQHKMYWNITADLLKICKKPLNHNIRCIEMSLLDKVKLAVEDVEPQHKMYWNVTFPVADR